MGEHHICDTITDDYCDYVTGWHGSGMESAIQGYVAEVSTGAIAALY